mgnify:CR=1 FL=1
MLAKYVLCILTIEWAVLGMRLLKGKGRSYERIRNDDRIREKEQFVLYFALVAFLTLLTTFAGSDRLTIRFFELTALALFGRLLYGNWKYSGKIWIRW